MGDIDESREIALLLVELVGQLGARHEHCAGECGLPLAQSAALYKLDRTLPMHELAERLGCHISNATGITDRLAARGFVEREDDPADRRIKRVSLTPAGLGMRARLLRCAEDARSPVDRLTADQRRELCHLLRIATDAQTLDVAQLTRRAARILGTNHER